MTKSNLTGRNLSVHAVYSKTEQRGMLEDFNKKGLSEFLEAVLDFFRISLNCFS